MRQHVQQQRHSLPLHQRGRATLAARQRAHGLDRAG
jgi:hypothetical protein